MFHLTKNPKEIEIYRQLGKKLAQIKKNAFKKVVVGANAWKVAKEIEEEILASGSYPCFKGYQGFPEAVCISVNEVLIHGIPHKNLIFKKDDLVKVDIGILFKGYCGDTAFSKSLGTNPQDLKIIRAAKEAFNAAFKILKEGTTVAEVEKAISKVIKKEGYFTTTFYSGHGIGKNLHEEPSIFNAHFLKDHQKLIFRAGMVVCIEPMLMQESQEIKLLKDGWGVKSVSGKKTAHFEQMVLILKDKSEILSGEEE